MVAVVFRDHVRENPQIAIVIACVKPSKIAAMTQLLCVRQITSHQVEHDSGNSYDSSLSSLTVWLAIMYFNAQVLKPVLSNL